MEAVEATERTLLAVVTQQRDRDAIQQTMAPLVAHTLALMILFHFHPTQNSLLHLSNEGGNFRKIILF